MPGTQQARSAWLCISAACHSLSPSRPNYRCCTVHYRTLWEVPVPLCCFAQQHNRKRYSVHPWISVLLPQ